MKQNSGSETLMPQGPPREQTGHTPGPWSIVPYHGSIRLSVVSSNDGIANVCDINMARSRAKENTHLIAAAPELLEAAERVECSCSIRERVSGHQIDCWVPALQAAINKARGLSPDVSTPNGSSVSTPNP